ncbi:hypothetical protein [Nitrosomonas sp. Is37]|uniref:hypothetical protein n=1 Tax=Nitrosomonas sp. Is37 TaxID=3080535 RepID=UPI00294B8BAB|nr:hypothetical protein [Nitrosomonas sp. Is37]MDV6343333.1 hypothetical protein [Nitrosomonas sp. Is37]
MSTVLDHFAIIYQATNCSQKFSKEKLLNLKTEVGRGGACGDQGARQDAMRSQGHPLQRRATPHSRLKRHMTPRSGLTILVNEKIYKMSLYIMDLTLQPSDQLRFLG